MGLREQLASNPIWTRSNPGKMGRTGGFVDWSFRDPFDRALDKLISGKTAPHFPRRDQIAVK
jgi:hypothetical protein